MCMYVLYNTIQDPAMLSGNRQSMRYVKRDDIRDSGRDTTGLELPKQ